MPKHIDILEDFPPQVVEIEPYYKSKEVAVVIALLIGIIIGIFIRGLL